MEKRKVSCEMCKTVFYTFNHSAKICSSVACFRRRACIENARYRAENRDKILAQRTAFRKTNPDRVAAMKRRYRVRVKASEFFHELRVILSPQQEG